MAKETVNVGASPRYFKTDTITAQPDIKVDREKGVLKDIVLCQVGEAKGHGVFLEQEFIDNLVKLSQNHKVGLKCRFGHPNMSTEALGTEMGRIKNVRARGEQAIGDLHLGEYAKSSPTGDLHKWALSIAEEDPDMCGFSIVFMPGPEYQRDENGNKYIPWKTPKEDGSIYEKDYDRPVYASIKELMGCDLVDEGAATDGIFSTNQFNADKFAVRITEFLDANPDIWQFVEQHPEKMDPFLKKYDEYKKKREGGIINKALKKVSNTIFGSDKPKESPMEKSFDIKATTEDGTSIIIKTSEGEAKPGDAVVTTDENGDETPAPDGNHAIKGGDMDGSIINVVDGKINTITPKEETTEPTPENPPASEDGELSAKYNALQESYNALSEKVKQLEEERKQLQAKIKEYESPAAEHTTGGKAGDTISGESEEKYSDPEAAAASKLGAYMKSKEFQSKV